MAYNEQDDTGLDLGEDLYRGIDNTLDNIEKAKDFIDNHKQNKDNKDKSNDTEDGGGDSSPSSDSDSTSGDDSVKDFNGDDSNGGNIKNFGESDNKSGQDAKDKKGSKDKGDKGKDKNKGKDKGSSNPTEGPIAKLKKKKIQQIKKRIQRIRLVIKICLAIFALMLSIAIFIVLTPGSLMFIVGFQYVDDVVESVSGFTQDISEWWHGVTTWWSDLFDGFEDSGEDEETISTSKTEAYETKGYNPNDEYNDSLKANYTVIESSLKKAYKMAVKEAKSYCKDNDLSWRKSKATLKNTGSASWDDVYELSNYGDYLSAVNIILEETGQVSSVTDPKDAENGLVTFDSEIFQDFMEDDNKITHLYHISYAPVPKDDNEEEFENYVTITICAYDWYDLFQMGDLTTDDSWDTNIDNYNFARNRTRQIEVLCNQENYELYKLQNQTPFRVDRSDATAWHINESSTSGSYVPVDGSNQKIMWAYLKSAGYSDIAAAGVMGNIAAESSFTTTWRGDGSSVGFCQWTGSDSNPLSRRGGLVKYAKDNNLEKTDSHAQAGYVIRELPGQMSKSNYQKWASATDIQVAADMICIYFERPQCYTTTQFNAGQNQYDKSRYAYSAISGKYHLDLPKRRDAAVAYYDMFAGTTGQE